jgi:MFS transporter, DHA1 family, tetracycline resistance protein
MRRSIPPHVFIYITAFLETIGAGLGRPVLPRLLQEITGKSVSQVGVSLGLLISAYAVALMGTSKLQGRLSDAFGRRPVLLLALVGSALDFVAAAMTHSFWVLFATRVAAGFFGATLVVCNVYIIDVTPQNQRSVRFGMLRGILAGGSTLGPVIGGVLGVHNMRTPFWVAAVVTGISGVYGFFFLPETLSKENRRPFTWKGALPFYVPKLSGLSIPLGVVITMLLFELGGSMSGAVTALYTQLRFGWTPANLGLFFGVGGVLSITGQMLLPRLLVPKLGDRRTAALGLSIFAFTLMLYGLVQSSWQLYVVLVIAQFGFIGIPALMSLTSNYATGAAQGELFGLLVAVATGAEVISPLIGSWLFTEFSVRNGKIFLPALPYYAGSAVLAASVIGAYMSGLFKRPPEVPKESLVEEADASTTVAS